MAIIHDILHDERLEVAKLLRLRDEPDSDMMSPEEIEVVLAAMDRMEPLQMTDPELAAWEVDRLSRKEWEKARFYERAEHLARMWE